MSNIILGTLLTVGFFMIFLLFGALLPEKYQSKSLIFMCLTGFMLYFSLFQVIALPMKILHRPLHQLTLAWSVLVALLCLFSLITRHKILYKCISGNFSFSRNTPCILIIFFISIALAVFLGFNTNSISDYDAAYYIGLPSSSVYSDTIELMSPYTGTMLEDPEHFYILNTDTVHSAVIYQLINLHPLVWLKWSWTIILSLLFEGALYKCGESLFQKEYQKTTVFFILSNLTLLFSYSLSGVSHYFAYRTYEGKAITCFFYTTVIFCFCLQLYKDIDAHWVWSSLFFCTLSELSFCNTAIFVVPCMIAITLIPYVFTEVFRHHNWKICRNYVLILLPAVMWLIFYKIL
ncbi:MAG: DUF6077 domain-containing protein [Eubacteriales bacterium]|nr:DUF6077 domain-containing protein [Eubacteriales bacterium]